MPWVREHLCPLALALGFLVLYTLTLADGGDPGKNDDCWTLLAAARHITPAYTTGYPLYMLLAIIGMRLPAPAGGCTVAFYASALPVTLAILLFYYCALSVTRSRLLAVAAAMLFGVSHGVWLVATNVYVYGVALLAQWAFYAALIDYETQPSPRRWLVLVAAFGGCGAAHPLNLILALPLLAWEIIAALRRKTPWRLWAWSGLILLVFLSLYLYLPITSPRNPERGDLRSVAGFVNYLTGEGRATHFAWSDGYASLKLLARSTVSWTHPAWFGLAIPGAALLVWRRRRLGGMLLISQALLLALIVFYYSLGHPQFYRFFLLGLLWLWAAVGARELLDALRRLPAGRIWTAAAAALLAVFALLQLRDTAALDYHVRRLRRESRPSVAVGHAMGTLAAHGETADLWCDRELLKWLQTRSSGDGFHGRDGKSISMEWNLHVVQPPDYALPASPPALVFTRHAENLPDTGTLREFDYGAGVPIFSHSDGGIWKPAWVEFDSPARQTPLRVVAMRVDWLPDHRLRVWSLVHVAGFHKPPRSVSYQVVREGGEVVGESHALLNHRGRTLDKLLYYDELVDVREIALAAAYSGEGLISVTPDFARPNMQRLPPPRVLTLLP